MGTDPAQALLKFQIEGEFRSVEAFGSGHIHDTYLACFAVPGAGVRRYVLQRINTRVFADPVSLMANIEGVITHLRRKILEAGGDPDREAMCLIPARDGKTWAQAPGEETWRAFALIEGARTYDRVENPAQFYQAGRAFGRFQAMMADYPIETLHETIPDFHHTGRRYEAFAQAVRADSKNRAASVGAEIEFVQRRAGDMSLIPDQLERGTLPWRVTHNDTKINNIMIDEASGEGVCVIDLDTVMPGAAAYDFGDAIRSGANPAAEDTRNLSQVSLDLVRFEAYSRGYLETCGSFLTPRETAGLALAARMMTLECGMRFLTDYLEGDLYFKTRRAEQNRDRARCQFRLVEDMEDKMGAMKSIVAKYA